MDIREASVQGCYNLYVGGKVAVSLESMTVCEAIRESLLRPMMGQYYSEGAEVADRIRNHYERGK